MVCAGWNTIGASGVKDPSIIMWGWYGLLLWACRAGREPPRNYELRTMNYELPFPDCMYFQVEKAYNRCR
jgi:hypothetical protein